MRLGDLDALKKEVENLVVGGEKGLKDYYENGSKSDENSWIGGVYDVWEIICNATTVEPTTKPMVEVKFDKEQMQELVDKAKAEVLASIERPQGEWISKRLWDNTHIWVCSECGNRNIHGISVEKACWRCGSDMRKGGTE